MSATGLYSGTYPAIRDFAELLDAVLVLLKANTWDASDERIKRVGQAFVRLGTPDASTPLDQVIGSVIVASSGTAMNQVVDLGKLLLAGAITPTIIDRLESIAASLESERASTFAKIRGR
jgi:hypothetical protein